MIAIIDYGMGNLGSIRNMLARIGADSVITSDHAMIRAAEKLILPGVGAFDKAMATLHEMGLVDVINRQVLDRRIPILGICLGMQLMSKGSEEGLLPGFGWIDADTVRFDFSSGNQPLRIPHMGWNSLQVTQKSRVLNELPGDSRFYFVHSYHVRCRHEVNVLAVTNYGFSFHSAIVSDNIIGLQFHPEKSHKFGMQVLRSFAEGAT